MASLMWFRRDLRLHDLPALTAAAANGPVAALFVLDDSLRRPSGAPRRAFLYRTLRSLDADLRQHGGRLIVRRGTPESVVPQVASQTGAAAVHISADFNPYGAARDLRVEAALGGVAPGGVALIRTGSPYAVAPGRVVKSDGEPFKVYSPFYRAWLAHGWPAPARTEAAAVDWRGDIASDEIPADPPLPGDPDLPESGETAARLAWAAFKADRLSRYGEERDRPDLDSTSRMSAYLKWGAVHPRTLLSDLGPGDETYRKELAWREFYAMVLHFWPDSARDYFLPEMAQMTYSTGASADLHLEAWKQGRTGYPIVDAGMRQLLGQGWLHNRVRMIVASFLVKDLHLEWTAGARHFMQHLVDGDLAGNQHGWQWTAGTGTDAAPYFRIFNPITQGRKFDPNGDYVRRWVPELRGIDGVQVHEPWNNGGAAGYPAPIVDHGREREVSLERYQAVRALAKR